MDKVEKSLKTDISIVGAGIIGCAIARELSKYDKDVLVIEKENDVSYGTTKANSGIIHAGYAEKKGTLRSSLCYRGNRLYREISDELDIPYKNLGSLVSVFDQPEIRILETLLQNGKKNGITDIDIVCGNDRLKEIEPNLNKSIIAGLYARDACITTPYEAAIALYENALGNGVKFIFNSHVKDIFYDKTAKNFYLTTENLTVESSIVINAAGVFADQIANMVGDFSFSIQPAKGEYLIFDKDDTNLVNIINFGGPTDDSKGVLVTPTVEGNLLIGPNHNYGDPLDLSTTAAGLESIKGDAVKLFPGLPFEKVISNFAGNRAVSDTGDFIIGYSDVNRKFINVAGIQSPGLTCAFSISEAIAELVQHLYKQLKPNKKFNPARKSIKKFYGHEGITDKALSQVDENYNEIVCRCENVTKAEILEAISRGARDVDGIKFRTRAGMGRCQGGYCLLRVMKILSEELNIPYQDVTKKGNGSVIAKVKMD